MKMTMFIYDTPNVDFVFVSLIKMFLSILSFIWFPLYISDTQMEEMLGDVLKRSCPRPRLLSFGKKASRSYRHSSVRGIVRRSRSITVDSQDVPGIIKICSYIVQRKYIFYLNYCVQIYLFSCPLFSVFGFTSITVYRNFKVSVTPF